MIEMLTTLFIVLTLLGPLWLPSLSTWWRTVSAPPETVPTAEAADVA